MTNAEYRKQRGTDKPCNCSEEQAKAIWTESIRKDNKWRSAKVPPTPPETVAAK